MYYKRTITNEILTGAAIHGPDFTLDHTTTDQTHDGWRWFDTPEEAFAHFAGTFDGHVTPRQFRLAILAHGIDPSSIDAMLADNPAGLIEWRYASSVDRAHPLVAALGSALNKSAAEIDAIFELARTL